MGEKKSQREYSNSKIVDHFMPKYHTYHKTFYNSENVKSIGVHGDKPYEKFFNPTQKFEENILMYNDNFILGKGTTKTSFYVPGYAGFIPKNQFKKHETNLNDPFSNIQKTNHILNYKTKIPRYQGHMSINPLNIKGNPRPFCLSTEGETYN